MGSHVRGKHALDRTKAPRATGSRKGGRRRAARPERAASNPTSKLPPFFGGLAIAAAVAGSLVTAPGDLAEHALAAGANPLADYTGTDVMTGRERAVSRDLSGRRSLDVRADELQEVVSERAQERNLALKRLATSATAYSKELRANRWVLPVGNYKLTGRFGDRSYLWSNFHTGLDFAAPTGTPIAAVAAGTVTVSGYDGSYGNKVVVRLKDGTEIWYCHMNRVAVSDGDQVAAGTLVGEVGSTGNVTGPHLHLEVRLVGLGPVDPEDVFPQHGVAP